jgi:hypothetical protein
VGGDDPADAMRSGGDEWAVKFPEEIEGVCEAKRWNAEMLKADAISADGRGGASLVRAVGVEVCCR